MKKREIIAEGVISFVDNKIRRTFQEKRAKKEEQVQSEEFFTELTRICEQYKKKDLLKFIKERLVDEFLEEENRYLPYDDIKQIKASIYNTPKDRLIRKPIESWGIDYYNEITNKKWQD